MATANGTVDFSGTKITSAVNEDNNFTITSGTGNVTISDAIGTASASNGEIEL